MIKNCDLEKYNVKKYCAFCMNASVEHKLSPNNDLSYIPVGYNPKANIQVYIRSGDERPTAIVVSMWDEKCQCNFDAVVYPMRYCPECGRRLVENEQYCNH